jgi:hypothetical protein
MCAFAQMMRRCFEDMHASSSGSTVLLLKEMQSSSISGAFALASDGTSDIEKPPTPLGSARSFYSVTAQTSGQQTARTVFYTPESSPKSLVSVSSRPSPERDVLQTLELHAQSPTPYVDAALHHKDLSVSAPERAFPSLADDACDNSCAWISTFNKQQVNESAKGEKLLEIGCSDTSKERIPEHTAATRADIANFDPSFTAEDMSDAYEMIPDLQITGREWDALGGQIFSKLDRICRSSVDDFVFISEVSPCGYDNNDDQSSIAMPNAGLPLLPTLNDQQILVATEPAMSMAPPIHISSSTELSCTFSSVREARESISLLSELLLQLQNMHGECNLDVLLTCSRLASAHHFIKDLVEAKNLYVKCLRISVRYARVCGHFYALF